MRTAGTHPGAGFLGTGLLPVFAEHGRPGPAYEPLLQDISPSWLGPLDKEATTLGEEGDGVGAEGRPQDALQPLR
ncbi:hypothetical protein KYY02_27600 [Streptomyces pimonensis]|uniref:Alpha-L-rhamnosidase six-hairpin glycosidase domain-containing protein n=1 Tax=Streptomyces pimonensis TaxID=2860288 RepID=A0ABV4J5R9_9ACTN